MTDEDARTCLVREFMTRCRLVVQSRGRKIEGKSFASRYYRDDVLDISLDWPVMGAPELRIFYMSAGLWAYSPDRGCILCDQSLQKVLDHLRQLMILDDIAGAV